MKLDCIWKPIPSMEDRYWVSSDGQVKSKFNRTLKSNSSKGQKCVSIIIDGQTTVYEIRHLIAYAFLGYEITNPVKPKLIHKDGNYSNIQLNNLELADYSDLEDEIWKDVKGFENIYQISNKGRVKRLPREDRYIRKDTGKSCIRRVGEKILKPSLSNKDGYAQINLVHKENIRYFSIHRLVAEAFIPNPDSLPQVNHIDGIRDHNDVSNLEWCTCQANVQDQIARSGRASAIAAIRKAQGRKVYCIETRRTFESIGLAAKELGCDSAAITSSIEHQSCCFGWTFIYAEDIDSLDIIQYMKDAHDKYFKWSRATVKEVDKWTNTYFPEA